jgi:hypothetical protein
MSGLLVFSSVSLMELQRVANIPRQISTYQATLLFQGSLKTVASRHLCGNTLPRQNSFLWPFIVFIKKTVLTTEYFAFRKLWPFSANKRLVWISNWPVLEKPEQELKCEI